MFVFLMVSTFVSVCFSKNMALPTENNPFKPQSWYLLGVRMTI